jgi:FSR family fosmidomycin resistance protein-like MFS transporter
MSLIGVAPSVSVLGILLFVAGFSAGVYHTTAPVIMKQVSGDKTGTGMSFFMFGGELARTLGPLLITAVVSIWGLEGTWKLIPLGVVGAIIIFFQIHRLPDVRPAKKEKGEQEPLLSALKKMKLLFVIIAPMLLFRAFAKTALTTFLPSYLTDDGLTVVQAGMVFALLEAVATIATLASGTLSDKFGRKGILVTVMILTPILMYLFTMFGGVGRLVIVALMGVVFFASTPVFMAMVHDMNSHYPAVANGMFMTINFAMSSIVSLIIGFLGDRYGLHQTYQITAILSIGAIPFALAIKDNSTNKKGV